MSVTYTREPGGARWSEPVASVVRRLRHGMNSAVLSFPLTPFDANGRLDEDAFRTHVRHQLAARPGALFPCCGTGEFFSLAEPEYEAVVAIAAEEAAGSVPVVAGAGYGWAQAARFAAIAEGGGADALLLMPPYLVDVSPSGFVDHVRQVASGTALPIIVYQRGQVKIAASSIAELAAIPSVIGIKDGLSDLDQVQRLRIAAPSEWLFFNGAATAEMQARAYRSIGVPAYSSAVHAFAPEISQAFFRALHADDHVRIEELLREFYIPLVELRDQGTGYAVSLIKAAARLRGAEVGPVRAPLTDPLPEQLEALDALVTKGLDLVGAAR